MTTETIGEPATSPEEALVNRKLYNLSLSALKPDPEQPRKFFDEAALAELVTSVRKHGILQPVLFRRDEHGQSVVISGERRFRAAEIAGLETIPAVFNENGNSAELSLVENLLRENLTPIEEAEALQRLKDEQGYTSEQVSDVIGKAPSTISEILSLNKLPGEVKEECRASSSFSRRALVEIAKADTPEAMQELFEKYKKMELKRDGVRAERKGTGMDAKWPKRLKRLREDISKLDLSALGAERSNVELELKYLATAIGSKLPVAA